jgi:WD40 repeat protein
MVWELASGRAVATLQGHTRAVNACAVTSDGRHVVSASYDKTLMVWELASGRAVATLQGHTRYVTACAVTPDGRHVVSTSDDKTLKVWELTSGRAVATLQGHTLSVNACAVTSDGQHVVSTSDDKTLKVWELATYTYRLTHRGDATYTAIAAAATTLIAGDAIGSVWFLDVPQYLASSIGAVETSHATSKTDQILTRYDRHASSSPTEERSMTREALLSRLSKLLPSQFEQVLFLARIPREHLSAATAAQALRAVELIRYVEQQDQLDQLAQIVQQVATGGSQAVSDPR